MSLYEKRINRVSAKIDEYSKSYVPPRYKELLDKYIKESSHSTVTMNIMITDLLTEEDHFAITSGLKELKGIDGIGEFQPKKLTVSYNQNETSLEHIVFKITQLGYRYINRF
ncbi:hypothetical protein F8154_03270 [Alkaliphilus pronyensis]|uniref:Heavy-metal-associated domain-containing protein n=1 Tax=Alkaliphilus pronyensis TaxID=1482732 RepID=A0A6I0F5Z6_9FIRM|nr:hypothetical protein [Alkaliphilus pronyensis]KAB3537325.1 hypothetical protein F8154_03270 [Alkaliphilus pronyensis]